VRAFEHVSYAFERIFEELRRDSAPVMGQWGVDCLRDSLADFEKQLRARGLTVETYDPIKYLRDCIEHPLVELRKFLHGEPSEISSHKSDVVFADALQSYFDELRTVAREIDQEYESEPQPVTPSQPRGTQKEIQLIVTTLGEPETARKA